MSPEQPVAVVLAAGRGSRMKASSRRAAEIGAEQARAAEQGLKALVPIVGEPLIARIMSSLRQAGIRTAVCVVRPGTEAAIMSASANAGLTVECVTQDEPAGTAHAVCQAKKRVGQLPFIVVNADNLFTVDSLTQAVAMNSSGLVAFRRSALLKGPIPESRVRSYAVVEMVNAGWLSRVVEKPDKMPSGDPLISMTLWRFESSMWHYMESVRRSQRGEYEIPMAVNDALKDGLSFRVVESSDPVVDISFGSDIHPVEEHLSSRGGV